MNSYLISAESIGAEKLKALFQPENVFQVNPSGVWAVGTNLPTASDVSNAVGIGDGVRGVVFKISEFYGWHDEALWQKLNAWRQF